MLAQILLMAGFVLIGVGLYLLKMNRAQSERYVWVGHGDDPFKN